MPSPQEPEEEDLEDERSDARPEGAVLAPPMARSARPFALAVPLAATGPPLTDPWPASNIRRASEAPWKRASRVNGAGLPASTHADHEASAALGGVRWVPSNQR